MVERSRSGEVKRRLSGKVEECFSGEEGTGDFVAEGAHFKLCKQFRALTALTSVP